MGQCASGPGQAGARAAHLSTLLNEDSAPGTRHGGGTGTSGSAAAGSRLSRATRRRKRNETKLLLLGTGNSGKSTVFKQFQLVHTAGFSDAERSYYASLIVESTIATIRKMLQHATDLLFEGDLPDEDFDRVLAERLQAEAQAELRAAHADAGVGGSVSFAQFLGETVDLDASRTHGSSAAGTRGTNASSSRGTNGSSMSAPILSSPSNSSSGGGARSLRDLRPSAAGGKPGAEPEPEQPHGSGSQPSRARGRGDRKTGGTVVSEDVAHLADIVRGLGEGTALYERFRVERSVWRDGAQETEDEWLTVAQMLRILWQDPVLQRVYAMDGKIPTLEAPIGYYMEHLDRIAQQGFVPSDADMLFARKQTRKVQQLDFKVESRRFVLVDPGGQRIERPNWVNYCENVDALLYVVGLDGFAQLCIEDGRTNRMRESLDVFRELCEAPFFAQTNVILFLNKSDLFEEKIRHVPLNLCFRSYRGDPHDVEETRRYIFQRFQDVHNASLRHGPRGPVVPKMYPYVTVATAVENMRHVIDACQAIFLRRGMAQSGIAAL